MYNMCEVIHHFQAVTVVVMEPWAKNYVS